MEILEKKDISYIWLYHHMDMSYRNFMNMIQNKTKAIQYEKLQIMCDLLDCSPNDLLVYVDDVKEQVKEK